MKKIINIALIVLLFVGIAKGQKIHFESNSWKTILKKAEQTNQLIFIDCYTSWCGPCKKMAKEVFTNPKVYELFNQQFINVKLDMEQKPGINLKQQFGVNAYPTLLLVNAKGEVVDKAVGFLNADKLIQFANKATNNKALTLQAYHKKYLQKGVSNPVFLYQYLQKLQEANEQDKIKQVVDKYFNRKNVDYKDTLTVYLLKNKVKSIENKGFIYLMQHQKTFSDVFTPKELQQKIYYTFLNYGNNLCDKKANNSYVLNAERKIKFEKAIKKYNPDKKATILAYADISINRNTKNWKAYVAGINKYLKLKLIDTGAMSLYNYVLPLEQNCTDKSLRKQATKWCDLGINSQMFKSAFEKEKNKLLNKKVK